MQSILVTGVAGLIGSRMAEWLVQNQPDYKIIGIDNLSGGYLENIPQSVVFYQRDLTTESIDDIFEENEVIYVYHLAAYAAEGLSPFIRKFNYTNNLVATAGIVNYCIRFGVKRLIFTSSMAVYGNGTPPFQESHIPLPVDPYGVAKYACELDIAIAGDQHDLDWCILRPHNVYGYNQNIWDKYRNVLGIWMYQKLNNEPFTIFGDGSQQRAFTSVDDCLKPFWEAAVSEKASKQIINIGSDIETRLIDAAEMLRDIVGGVDFRFLDQRHEVMNAFSTHEKAVSILHYSDKTPLKKGLTDMWAWVQKQPIRERMEWKSYELDKGMYAFWKTK